LLEKGGILRAFRRFFSAAIFLKMTVAVRALSRRPNATLAVAGLA